MKKFSPKHIEIFKTITKHGKYKPTYSDHEPATKTLIKNGIIDWNESFSGLIFTELGKVAAIEALNNHIGIAFCKYCLQITNHKGSVCLKCKHQ